MLIIVCILGWRWLEEYRDRAHENDDLCIFFFILVSRHILVLREYSGVGSIDFLYTTSSTRMISVELYVLLRADNVVSQLLNILQFVSDALDLLLNIILYKCIFIQRCSYYYPLRKSSRAVYLAWDV